MGLTQVSSNGAQVVATPRIAASGVYTTSTVLTQANLQLTSFTFTTYAPNTLIRFSLEAYIATNTTGWFLASVFGSLDGTTLANNSDKGSCYWFDSGTGQFPGVPSAEYTTVVPNAGSHTIVIYGNKNQNAGTVSCAWVGWQVEAFDTLITVGGVTYPVLATAPANPAVSQMYWDTTVNNLRIYNGSVWVPFYNHSGQVIQEYASGPQIPSGTATAGNSVVVYTTPSFTKQIASSTLRVEVRLTGYVTGVAGGINFGYSLDGAPISFGSSLIFYFNQLSSHTQMFFQVDLTGVAAGSHTLSWGANPPTGSGTYNQDSNDRIYVTIREIFP